MKEGFWLNWQTNRYVELLCTGVDHEMTIRSPSSHEWLGVPRDMGKDFRPRLDRDAFLKHVMATLPLIRVRGHGGTHITIEFHSKSVRKPFEVIGKWAKKYPAPNMPLHVVNLATGDCWDVAAGDWDSFVSGITPAGGGAGVPLARVNVTVNPLVP